MRATEQGQDLGRGQGQNQGQGQGQNQGRRRSPGSATRLDHRNRTPVIGLGQRPPVPVTGRGVTSVGWIERVQENAEDRDPFWDHPLPRMGVWVFCVVVDHYLVADTLEIIRGEDFSVYTSQWSIVFDTLNLRAYFRTADALEVRYVDLETFDLTRTIPIHFVQAMV